MKKTRRTKLSHLTPSSTVNRSYRLPVDTVIMIEELAIKWSEQTNMHISMAKVLTIIVSYIKRKSIQEILNEIKNNQEKV